jgi:hypothetical protein
MSTNRYEFTATLLQDGRVFVAGGKGDNGALDSTEIFDPKANTWSAGPKLSAPRSNHAAALLKDGMVAVIGGGDSDDMGLPSGDHVLDTVDLFDPKSGMITDGPKLSTGREFFQAAVLADGRVLVAGGTTSSRDDALDAEVLDAAHTAFSAAGTLAHGHSGFTMTILTSGDAFLTGGISATAIEASAESYDSKTNIWTPLPEMSDGRLFVAVAPLSKGGVLAAGGIDGQSNFLISTETLASGAASWKRGPDLPASAHEAVGGSGVALLRLANGTVLGAGAYGSLPITDAFGPGLFSGVFDEKTSQWTNVAPLDTPRGIGQMVELADHRVLLAGGIGVTNGATASCSITAAPID